MKLSHVAEIVSGTLVGDDAQVSVEASFDSRDVPSGGIFAAVAGERVNGHQYVAPALAGGAGVALVSERVDASPLIVVDDVPVALGKLAAAHVAANRRHLTVLAVTGSMGKTTTKDLLAGILPGPTVASEKSLNNELGVPLTCLRCTPETRYLVLEMGADRVGDLAYLTSLVPPDLGIVLAVGSAHLEKFGTVGAVAKAKSELIQGLTPGGTAVLNADDPRVAGMASLADDVVFFGADAEVRAENLRLDSGDHASFDLVTPFGIAPVELGLVGAHHVANALAAAAAAMSVGIATEEIAARLSDQVAASPHRMHVVERADGVTVIDDSYNANPQSMASGIEALARIGRGRRTVAVLGPMLELGDVSEAEHRAVGELLAARHVEIVHLLGPIAATIAPAGIETHIHQDLDGIRAALAEQVRSGDVLLFKSSNGARLHEVAQEWIS
ncbi:UDP-N-acetylmuramoyl-tripeptide--D-alanyl-D-alanine ligase [Ruaniaceae bacterium KH17]|nr:UDP-N-acetylmuramoyl-tripeptide--D-alanyl-D-alanine ligase [Ruaniaceae bacterium KH17]